MSEHDVQDWDDRVGPESAELDGFPETVPSEASRDPLELLLSEFVDRQRRGEAPSIDELVRQHPQFAEEIRDLFPMVAAMEHWKGRQETELVRHWLSRDLRDQQVGPYRLTREIGRGGMGIVFEAQAPAGRPPVAIKLLPWRSTGDARYRLRFQQEFETVSRLKHRHIVPVLDRGEWDGLWYCVMPLVGGMGLDRLIAQLRDEGSATLGPPAAAPAGSRSRGPLTVQRTSWKVFATWGLHAAQALGYAHGERVIHRDVKPGNILIDGQGRVWITDFGLAETLDVPPSDPRSEPPAGARPDAGPKPFELAGTLRYMAPERFAGRGDERSDVYGLGVTLYELLTTAARGLHQMPSVPGARQLLLPRAVAPEVPADLEAVVMRATAADPQRRYATALELAEDLKRFLENRPVAARRAGLWRRWRDGRCYRKFLRGLGDFRGAAPGA